MQNLKLTFNTVGFGDLLEVFELDRGSNIKYPHLYAETKKRVLKLLGRCNIKYLGGWDDSLEFGFITGKGHTLVVECVVEAPEFSTTPFTNKVLKTLKSNFIHSINYTVLTDDLLAELLFDKLIGDAE